MKEAMNTAKAVIGEAQKEAAFAALEAAVNEVAREATIIARLRRQHYEASLAAGFSPAQALYLCRFPLLNSDAK